MGNKIKTILGLLAFIILMFMVFPDRLSFIIYNKFYMTIGALSAFLIIFWVWLSSKNNF